MAAYEWGSEVARRAIAAAPKSEQVSDRPRARMLLAELSDRGRIPRVPAQEAP
jgi:hypothetical protein